MLPGVAAAALGRMAVTWLALLDGDAELLTQATATVRPALALALLKREVLNVPPYIIGLLEKPGIRARALAQY